MSALFLRNTDRCQSSQVNKLGNCYCLRWWANDEDFKKDVRGKYDEKWLGYERDKYMMLVMM